MRLFFAGLSAIASRFAGDSYSTSWQAMNGMRMIAYQQNSKRGIKNDK